MVLLQSIQAEEEDIDQLFDVSSGFAGFTVSHVYEITLHQASYQPGDISTLSWPKYNSWPHNQEFSSGGCNLPGNVYLFSHKLRSTVRSFRHRKRVFVPAFFSGAIGRNRAGKDQALAARGLCICADVSSTLQIGFIVFMGLVARFTMDSGEVKDDVRRKIR